MFDLSLPGGYIELPIPLLLARGYKKPNIVACFEELERRGFGKFDRGSQGRSKVGRFIPNETCPIEFAIDFQIKSPGRPKKMRSE
jgi:hypothetical protein